jgi:peptidoglycan hydrolase-like protein with peptidoglycan-binding domain
MRKSTVFILALILCMSLAGCSKKQEALEEMQQPMSPEDLNRLKTETATAVNPTATVPVTATVAPGETALEPFLQSGPYRPTVQEIQTALKNAGYYPGAIDGKAGPMTKKAIEDFQQANGLQIDGKVGTKTWGLLGKYLSSGSIAGTTATTQ